MTEEPTMAEEKAKEAAQRVYAKRQAANRESMKRKRAEESQQQRENRLAAKRESMKRKRAEESQQQRKNRLASQREITNRKRAEESQEQPENFRLICTYIWQTNLFRVWECLHLIVTLLFQHVWNWIVNKVTVRVIYCRMYKITFLS